MTASRARAAAAVLAMLLLAACGDDDGATPDEEPTTTQTPVVEGELPEDSDDRSELVLDRATEICDEASVEDIEAIVGIDLEPGDPTHLALGRNDRRWDVAWCDFQLPDGFLEGVAFGEVFPVFGEELGVPEVRALLAEQLEDRFSDAEEVAGLGEVAFVRPSHEGHELWIATDEVVVRVATKFEDREVPLDQLVALGELALGAVG
jgi:hypothetical protein